MSIATEAVQVAAVAAALVEDLTGPTTPPWQAAGGRRVGRRWWDPIELVLGMVHDERKRQEEKWGRQQHLPVEWLMILAEEVGELAAAVRDASGETGDARALAVIRLLVTAGEEAKAWVRDHPWPQRQQRVIDGEGGERPGSGRRDGS